VRLLLDTHVWLWWNTEPERLSPAARRQIADARNEVFVSAASVWEIAIKQRLGKLPLPEPVYTYVARRLATDDMQPLSISVDHAAGVEALELRHRDPFDRLLIVQARREGLRLLTADDQVLAYGNPTVDARAREKA
jgi:PIN domain nuclease of toxin-antitoxin system